MRHGSFYILSSIRAKVIEQKRVLCYTYFEFNKHDKRRQKGLAAGLLNFIYPHKLLIRAIDKRHKKQKRGKHYEV